MYRWTTENPTPARQTVDPLNQTSWTDSSVTNGVAYSYAVSAVDTSGNESAASSAASATPAPAPEPGVVYVSSLSSKLVSAGRRNRRAVATVSVVDESGQGVEGLSVTVAFSGDVSGTGASLTDADGIAIVQGPKKKGAFSFTACVESVSGAGWTYDPASNTVTCSATGS